MLHWQSALLKNSFLYKSRFLVGVIGINGTRVNAGYFTVNVANGEGDLSAELLLVKFHAYDLIREAFVEEPVDLGTARQLQCVDRGRSAAFDRPFEVLLQLLNAPAK